MGRDYTLYALIDGHVTFEKPLPNQRQRVSVRVASQLNLPAQGIVAS
jgi:ribosomal protein L27